MLALGDADLVFVPRHAQRFGLCGCVTSLAVLFVGVWHLLCMHAYCVLHMFSSVVETSLC
jgi:hypothetical protein